ncbi:class IIb bacteriocin, lactobin A/cerein 7B family [Dapis sp. BLCC M229]|uniref:class IIb bacteriocin, lactobin A/cerein 7B family n=1 Tax=Dapis sp. BLCC M229 TaxID=3400188 RepID=UPI003CEAB581
MTTIHISDLDKTFTNDLVEDLSNDELELIRGGILPLVALGVAAFGAGVALYAAVKN